MRSGVGGERTAELSNFVAAQKPQASDGTTPQLRTMPGAAAGGIAESAAS